MDGRSVTPGTSVSRRRFRLLGAGVGAAALAVGAGFVWPIATGRGDPPFYDKLKTQSALRDARRADAGRWDPASMREAEAAMKAAAAAYRLEEVKFFPFRDFRGSRSALAIAMTRIEHALAQGNRRRLEAQQAADEALAAAERDVSRSDDVAETMHLGPYNRTLLQKSKIALAEARSMHDRGDFL
jgi:hypothetical protein